ncbi:MAG: TonB-dependent receptor [Tannerella sp.]|jgi:TonB-linked SusC/RagA family outer membrane protein|nr:TonB-dependent receptor [Tannerella sp.]
MRKFLTNKQTKMRKSLSAYMAFLLLWCAASAFGQTGTVTGTVTDQSGETLIGVNVSVKGTTSGTITDFDGKFSIPQVPSSAVLVFSYVGYVTQEIPVGNNRVFNVQLREDSQSLEELVVVGYGSRKAGELTGAVSTVKAGDIQKIAAVTAGEALVNVPGLFVTQSYTPGANPNVRVRGLGTINDTSPLWVVDGVPGGTVNPNDIETITVLKDAAAQAIYGTRAANGVILVTTKMGKKNERVNVTLNMRAGFQNNPNHYKFLNTMEYGQLLWLQFDNDGKPHQHQLYGSGPTPVIPDYINPLGGVIGQVDESKYKWSKASDVPNLITRANKEGTDWFKEIERDAFYSDLSLSVSGGSDKTTYSFTLGYLKNEGVLKYTGYDRFNLRSSIRTDVNKWLTIGQSVTAAFTNQFGQLTNNSEDSAISWAYRIQPIVPVYDVGGNYAGSRAAAGPLGNARNPLGVLYYEKDRKRERLNLSGNIYANINIIEGLQFRTLAALNYGNLFHKFMQFQDYSHSEGGSTIDNVQMTYDFSRQWNWTNTLEYKKSIGLHDFTIIAGTEAISNFYYEMTARRNNYLDIRDPNYMELSSGIDNQQNGSTNREWAIFSVFGRLNYVFDGKYMLEAVIRRDGSSRFAADYRYGVFPAMSAGWVVSKESFMAPTKTWLNNLKLRFGYGMTGNDQMGNYNSYSTYRFQWDNVQGTYYAFNGANGSQGTTGFRQDLYGITNVKWETTTAVNLGVDASLRNGLSVTFDIWKRNTTDMLYPKQIPATAGRVSTPSVNVGEMENKGFDLDLGYSGTALGRDLQYRLGLNISSYQNKIIKLSGAKGEFLEGGAQRQQVYTRTESGRAFPEFFGYTVEGIFQTQAEADAHPIAFGMGPTIDEKTGQLILGYNQAGRYKFKDVNGDNEITAADRTYIGSPHPKFTGGLNFDLSYKGFDITGQFYGSYGNKVMNYVRRWLDYDQFIGGRSWESLYKSWGSPYLQGKATLPKAETGNPSTINQNPSTALLEDASYLRLRTLQIGYNLGKLFNSSVISQLRIYAQVTNLFTLTKYSGLDPETNSGTGRDATRNYGLDMGAWQTPRQFMLGIDVGF